MKLKSIFLNKKIFTNTNLSTFSRLINLKHSIRFTSSFNFCSKLQAENLVNEASQFDLANVEKSMGKTKFDAQKQKRREESSSGGFEKTLITTELLAKLIGTKHYPSNEEIKMDRMTIVKTFNENDDLLGNKTLAEVFDDARELGKDVVLRNEKSNPPVVKIMRYKIELVKRLLRKLSKSKDFKLSEAKSEKFISIPINIEQNDLITKINKCRELLKHFSHLKLAVFCEINDNNFFKCQNLLNHIADDLNDVCKISTPVAKSFQKKTDSRTPIENLEVVKTDERHEQIYEESLSDKYVKNTDNFKLEDMEYNDSIVIELESMLVDTSGIDYEMLLESKTIEDIFNGLKNNKFDVGSRSKKKEETIKGKAKKSSKSIASSSKSAKMEQSKKDKSVEGVDVDDAEAEKEELEESKVANFQEQLTKLEKTLEAETDLSKRLVKRKKIIELKKEIEYQKTKIYLRLLLKKTFDDFFSSVSSKKS